MNARGHMWYLERWLGSTDLLEYVEGLFQKNLDDVMRSHFKFAMTCTFFWTPFDFHLNET